MNEFDFWNLFVTGSVGLGFGYTLGRAQRYFERKRKVANMLPDCTFDCQDRPVNTDRLYEDFAGLTRSLSINNVECIYESFTHEGRSIEYRQNNNPWLVPQVRVSGHSVYGDMTKIAFLLQSGAWERLVQMVQSQHRKRDADRLQRAAKEAEEVGPLIEKIQDQVNSLVHGTVEEA